MLTNAIRRLFAVALCLVPGAGLAGQSYEAFRSEWARVWRQASTAPSRSTMPAAIFVPPTSMPIA